MSSLAEELIALGRNLPLSFRVGEWMAGSEMAAKAVPAVVPKDLPPNYTPHRFAMAATFPMPALPRDNPLIEERIGLGRRLFHETALSADGSIACASCHGRRPVFPTRVGSVRASEVSRALGSPWPWSISPGSTSSFGTVEPGRCGSRC